MRDKLSLAEIQCRLKKHFKVIEQCVLEDPNSIVHCKKCGNDFKCRLHNLIRSGKCSICEKTQVGRYMLSKIQVDYRLNSRRLELVGKYHGGRQPLTVRCLDCKKVFSSTASKIFRGLEGICYCKRTLSKWSHRDPKLIRKMFLKMNIIVDTSFVGELVNGRRDYRRKMKCLKCGHEWLENISQTERRAVACRNNDCRKAQGGNVISPNYLDTNLTEEEELRRIDEGIAKMNANGNGKYIWELD